MKLVITRLTVVDEKGVTAFRRLAGFAVKLGVATVKSVFFKDDGNREVIWVIAQRAFEQLIGDFTVGDTGAGQGRHAVAKIMRHIARVVELLLDFQRFALGNLA